MARGSAAVIPGVPSIYVDYAPDCSFVMTADGGFAMNSGTSGPTLPPGNYQLVLHMPNPVAGYACTTPVFSFTGPGVNSQTTFAMESIDTDVEYTLQPSSTYVAVDRTAGASTQRIFATAATGSSSSLLPGTTTTTTTGGGKGSSQPGLVGSKVATFRGKLTATVGANGKATFKRAGKTVGSLKAGRYEISVSDKSARAGFFITRRGASAISVTSLAFEGKRTRVVALAAGQWSFSTKVGRPTAFIVVTASG
jgi:hypothetical protein